MVHVLRPLSPSEQLTPNPLATSDKQIFRRKSHFRFGGHRLDHLLMMRQGPHYTWGFLLLALHRRAKREDNCRSEFTPWLIRK